MGIDIRIVAALLLASFVAGLGASNWYWEGKWARAEKQAIQNQLGAIAAINAEHNKLVADLEGKNRETEKKLAEISVISDDTVTVGDSLQQQFTNSLRNQCAKTNPTTTTRDRAADATDQLVQAYVFGVVKDRAIEYARIADTNRIRGLSCQQSYEALRLSCGVKF
jgi:predicted RNA-binding protein